MSRENMFVTSYSQQSRLDCALW